MTTALSIIEPVAWLTRGGLLLGGAGLAAFVFRHTSAAWQAWGWRVVLALALLLAPLSWLAWPERPAPLPIVRADTVLSVTEVNAEPAFAAAPTSDPFMAAPPVATPTAAQSPVPLQTWRAIVWGIWAAGAVWELGRWTRAWLARERLARGATEMTDPALVGVVGRRRGGKPPAAPSPPRHRAPAVRLGRVASDHPAPARCDGMAGGTTPHGAAA